MKLCGLLTFLLSQTAFGFTPASQLQAPHGFHWVESSDGIKKRLNLVNGNDRPTNITYEWIDGLPLFKALNRFDPFYDLSLPKRPGRTPFHPHRESEASLEEVFLKNLAILVGEDVDVRVLQVTNGENFYSTIDDFLPAYQNLLDQRKSLGLSAKRYFEWIQSKVETSRHKLLEKAAGKSSWKKSALEVSFANCMNVPSDERDRRFECAPFAAVEPLLERFQKSSTHPGASESVNAFSLFPLQSYLHNPGEFHDALKNLHFYLKNAGSAYSWLKKQNFLPLDLRLSAIALITHNHHTEINLVKLVALQESVTKAWQIQSLINELYDADRLQAISKPNQLRQSDLLKRVYNPNNFPENRRFIYEHDDEEVYELEMKEWIPLRKRYHWYGGIIAGIRLRQWGLTQTTLNSEMTALLGMAYKVGTAGFHSPEIPVIRKVYLAAGEAAKQVW